MKLKAAQERAIMTTPHCNPRPQASCVDNNHPGPVTRAVVARINRTLKPLFGSIPKAPVDRFLLQSGNIL